MSKDDNLYDEEEGARPSSLRPVHKLSTPDPLYDQQLLRDLAIINERTRKELGPLPHKGVPAKPKRKPELPYASLDGAVADILAAHQSEENDTVKLQHLAMVAALGVAADGVTAEQGTDGNSRSAIQHIRPDAKIPPRFVVYASAWAGDDGSCVVGAVSNDDAMNLRPYAYLTDAMDGRVRWVKALGIPKDFYEGRATHCVRKGAFIYALVQVETHSQRSLSQTVLHVVKLRFVDGTIVDDVEVLVPGVDGIYSSWVRKGEDRFRQVDDDLLVTGEYRYLDSEDALPFSVAVKP